ncbi:hypothetical protein MMC12_008491 [Toensbergia leucococca]|nr:hypothetical protein [Toensbergia leucococca]
MDSSGVQIVKPSGGIGILDPSDEMTVKQVLREVEDGGWVVLKGCTRATASCVKKDIVDNEFIQAILALARDGKYIDQVFKHFQVKASDSQWGRSSNWEALAKGDGLAGFSCIHLGGTDADEWVIELDMGLRGQETGNIKTVKANGTDIFLCAGWLKRKAPSPQSQDDRKMDFIWVNYMWTGLAS